MQSRCLKETEMSYRIFKSDSTELTKNVIEIRLSKETWSDLGIE